MPILAIVKPRPRTLVAWSLICASSTMAIDTVPSERVLHQVAAPTASILPTVGPYAEDVCFETRGKQCGIIRDGCINNSPNNPNNVAMCNNNYNACISNADRICHPRQ